MTLPLIDPEHGIQIPAKNATVRVVPMNSGRVLILEVDGQEHAIRLGPDGVEKLVRLLSEERER